MKHASVPQHNYVTKLHRLWQTGALPRDAGYHEISVAHDDWCGIFQDQRCDCDPDITFTGSLAGQADN
jgi:hypothetical protein